MIIIKTKEAISLMREGGMIGARVLKEIKKMVVPGITTADLNYKVEELLKNNNAKPAFKGFAPFDEKKYPASLCTSINEEVVHGIPSNRKLKNGDIIGLDLGVYYKGYYTDMAITVGVGKIDPKLRKLIKTTRKALDKAISHLKEGVKLGDLGYMIQQVIENNNFSVIRDCVGHGIGKSIHEDPSVPNYGNLNTGITLKEGMTLAIEPMAALGKPAVRVKEDGWTIATVDSHPSAHFEQTIIINKNNCQTLTPI